MIDIKTQKKLRITLRRHTKALGIAEGAAESFIDLALKATVKTFKNREIITEKDLKRVLSKELKKYNSDLAYVYKNYDKII